MGDLEMNGVNGNKDPEGGDHVEYTDDVEEEYAEEYAALDSTLDQLDSCLDALESKNDDLVGKLKALLEDSRQARSELGLSLQTSDDASSDEQAHSERVEKLTITDSAESQENSERTEREETDNADSGNQESSSQ